MTKEDSFLQAENLANDPRIAQAKKLILEAVNDHQKKLNGVKPPHAALQEKYQEKIKAFSKLRGANLFFPYIGSGLGNGALVELLDGSVKYDFITGIGVHCFGHSHLDIISSAIDAAYSNTIMQGNLQQNADAMELCEFLVKNSGLDHCFLTSNGAMANENALKIAFQKKYPASRVIAFDHCFTGRSLGTSQITDKPAFREGLPPTLVVDYIPFLDIDRPEVSTKESINRLKQLIKRYPRQHAAMIFELVQGEGGFYPGTKEYFIELMQICKDSNITIIDDEVQTFGRLPTMFAFQYFELDKYVEIVNIGKLTQLCATLYRNEFAPRPGLLSQTFTGSTSAIKACLQILKTFQTQSYFGSNGKIQRLNSHFIKRLKELKQKHPAWLHGPFGVGTMIALTPFDGNSQVANKLVHKLFDNGVLSFVAGSDPTRVRFLLPVMAIEERDIDQVCDILEKTLNEISIG